MSKGRQALLLQVEGLSAETLNNQSLHNLWNTASDTAGQCLARALFRHDDVRSDVLERITWALLAWPGVTGLSLVDSADGSEVAAVQRAVEPGGYSNAEVLQWRDYWLRGPQPSGAASIAGANVGAGTFPPQRAKKPGIFALNEKSLAQRERVWRKVHDLFGERPAVFAYRLVQGIVTALRRTKAKPCPIDTVTLDALRAMPRGQGDDSHIDPDAHPGVALFIARLSPGGAEKSALDLAATLADRGVPVHLFTTFGSQNTWTARALAAGVRAVHLPQFLPRGCWPAFVEETVQRHRIGVLHINNSHWLFEHVRMLKTRLPHLRVISQLHAEGRAGTRDFLSLAAEADAAVDCHSVISNFLRNRLLTRFTIDPSKVVVVRTGIDIGVEFDRSGYARGTWRRRQGMADDVPLVAFVGRFSDLKRPLLFLSVARRVLEQRPEVRFVLKGDGPLQSAIESRLASDAMLAQAVMIEDAAAPVQPVMVDADLMLLTSAMEGIAYVSYEAMALGLVQVSADVGAQSELVTAECGLLVTTGDGETERFANAVLSLLDDPERRARLAAAGVARVHAWPSIDDMADAYQLLYCADASAADGAVARARQAGESHVASLGESP